MNKRVLIICNCSSGLNDFRGMLIDRLISLEKNVYAIVPISNMKEELFAEIELARRGCELIKVPIDRRGMNPIADIKLFFKYRKIIKAINPCMVLTYTIKPNVYGGMACRLARVPYVINITGLGTAFENNGFLRKIVVLMNKVACKKAKVVFFENEENRKIFVKERIVKKEQTHRLNGAGVDIDKYQVCDYPSGDSTKFLFMGRVMAEKGINELFGAMKMLIEDGIRCELVVLGGYEENYKEIIEKYESQGWLSYHGYQTNVRPFIAKSHCFVLPSWHEGMANTNLESAACGRPVITSNIHGCLEAVIDGKTGYLVEKNNVDDLYRVMKKFVNLSYEERKAMGLAGREHIENLFDKKKVVEETLYYLFR